MRTTQVPEDSTLTVLPARVRVRTLVEGCLGNDTRGKNFSLEDTSLALVLRLFHTHTKAIPSKYSYTHRSLLVALGLKPTLSYLLVLPQLNYGKICCFENNSANVSFQRFSLLEMRHHNSTPSMLTGWFKLISN